MDMYRIIKNQTEEARIIVKTFEQAIVINQEELLKLNSHTNVYKILDPIDEFK